MVKEASEEIIKRNNQGMILVEITPAKIIGTKNIVHWLPTIGNQCQTNIKEIISIVYSRSSLLLNSTNIIWKLTLTICHGL